MATADIARTLGIRYQHAYNVLRRGLLISKPSPSGQPMSSGYARPPATLKPKLCRAELLDRGFRMVNGWALEGDLLSPLTELPDSPGVYAFVSGDEALYVGVSVRSLRRRLKFYAKPGKTQRTSTRLNGLLIAALQAEQSIDVLIAQPPDLDWNGFRISGHVGLEDGLIRTFNLPWNKRGT